MSKIIDFPAVSVKAPEEDVSQIYSLADLGGGAIDVRADLVSVIAAGQGASVEVPLQGKPETSSTDILEINPCVADWDNQELASLYRAQRLLGLTGISFDVGRGLSDEGDPWFVFIDDTGEVLAHFCRMEGMYHLDSAAQSDLLIGHSLESLVTGFAQRNQPVTHKDRSAGEAQVVYLAGNAARSNVMMHPGVSLAALVWSIYMLSDTLVLPTYGTDAHDLGADLEVEDADISDMQMGAVQSSVDHLALPLNLQGQGAKPATAMQNAGTQSIGSESRDAFAAAVTTVSGPIMGMGNSSSMNAVGLGLSTLAMSYGIHLLSVPLTTVQMAKDVASSVNSLLTERALPDGTLVDVQAFSDNLMQAVDRIKISDVVILDATDKATLGAVNGAVQAAGIVEALVWTTLASDGLKGASVAFEVSHDSHAPVVADVNLEVVKQDIQEESGLIPAASQDIPVAFQNDEAAANVLHTLSFVVKEQELTFEFTKSDVLGEQDYIELMMQASSGLDAVVEVDLNTEALVQETEIDQFADPISAEFADPVSAELADPVSAESVTKIYPVFDDAAYDFVVFFMMKQDDAQQSFYNGEVILIDKGAFEVANAEVYARTWSFEDGSILSTVGSKSDFEAFGLII